MIGKMISRVYNPFKPLTTRVGIHSYLKVLYSQSQPHQHVSVYNRDAIRKQADTVNNFSSSELVEISPLPDAVNPPSDFQKIKKVDTMHELDQPFVAEFNNGRVLEQNGFCTTSDYTIILDTVNSRESRVRNFYRNDMYACMNLLYRQTRSGTEPLASRDVDTAVSFIRNLRSDGSRMANYSHWLQGYLTRLEAIDYYQTVNETRPKIIIEQNPPSWILESLELLGYSDDILFWDPTEELRVHQLVVPSVRRSEEWRGRKGVNYKVLSKQACEWLQSKAISNADVDESKFSEKVFISRADAERRRIQNRENVVNHLQDRGFESYELTKLSFPEQVALFAQADEVVGVHGAGLANIMFASDCTVTEIVGDIFKPTYYIMSEILNLEYRLVQGDSIEESEVRTHHQDVRIDPEII